MRRRQVYFVTGTDTEAGKTYASVALLKEAVARGWRCLGLKPVAAGGIAHEGSWRNEDALRLMRASTLTLPYEVVNPFCLPEAMAPHIAAARAGKRLLASQVVGILRGAIMQSADLVLIEGVGGWRTPLNERESMAAVAQALQLPVILVVGLRLGCLNHALLSGEAIRNDGLVLKGWIGSVMDASMPALEENIDTLKRLLPAPCLGILPYSPEPVAGILDVDALAAP